MTVIYIIVAIIIVAVIFTNLMLRFKLKSDASLDFGKTFKKTGCPIVTLTDNNGLKLNFLVDTGSNISHLKRGVVERVGDAERVIPVDKNGKPITDGIVTTAGGDVTPDAYYRVNLFHGERMLTEVFEVMDLNSTFDGWGVEIHGILGGSFIDTHKYVIDYPSKKMYIK